MAEVKIKKNQVIPFLDISNTLAGNSWTPQWKRIDKSTIFDLAFNPQSESTDYISMESAVEVVSSYNVELPQEIALERGNAIYDFVEQMCINLPTGDQLRVPLLLCWPPAEDKSIAAWQCKDTVLLLSNYNSVDGKISFTLKIGGDRTIGTATIVSGSPSFTPKSN